MVKNFYDWLMQVSDSNENVTSFKESFGKLTLEEQLEAFEWLKLAYVSGVENAGVSYPFEQEVNDESETPVVHCFSTVLKNNVRIQPQFRKLIHS